MIVDADKVQASGPWVFVKPESTTKVSPGGIFLPDGNLMERLGHTVARVVSVGKGHYETHPKTGKTKFVPSEVKPGDRVVFRGHLKEGNRVNNGSHCFMHVKDLILVLSNDTELTPALPYDN